VIKNYNFSSLHHQIKPLILAIVPYWYSDVYIRLRSDNMPNTIAFIKEKIQATDPSYLFEYQFLDEEIDNLYKTEQRMGRLVQYGTFWAIFISCLGLFGLASFTVAQRRKEIGIRKVLGASVGSILLSLLKQFTKWVLIANIFSWPIAYIVMNLWLQNFAFKTDFTLSTFIVSSLMALIIAAFTVSYQSIKAATSNPIDSIRYE